MMTWTRNAPKVAGWYWFRYKPTREPEVVYVGLYDGDLGVIGKGLLDYITGEWSSTPIAMPTGGNDAVDR